MKKIMTLIISFLIATSVMATQVAIDKSVVKWKASKGAAGFKLSSHNGKVKIQDAKVLMADGKLTGGKIVMNMKEFTVDDISGKYAMKLLNHLKSNDFFKISEFDTATLNISKVKGNKMMGDLTINGIKKPITIAFTNKNKMITGKFTFNRLDYSITYNKSESLGDKFIHKDVEIDFNIALK